MHVTFNVFFDLKEIESHQRVLTLVNIEFPPHLDGKPILDTLILNEIRRFSNLTVWPTLDLVQVEIILLPEPVPVDPKETLGRRLGMVQPQSELIHEDVTEYIKDMQNKQPSETAVLFVVRIKEGYELEVVVNLANSGPGPVQRYKNALEAVEQYQASTSTIESTESNPLKAILDEFQDPQTGFSIVAPPIHIFHPVFQEFLRLIDEPSEPLAVTTGTLSTTAAFMRTACCENESVKETALVDYLTYLLEPCRHLSAARNSRIKSSVDLVSLQLERGVKVPLLPWELNCKSIGEKDCNPTAQVVLSAITKWATKSMAPIRSICCCPCFLLAVNGPYICVLGMVFTDRIIVQPLTDLIRVGEACSHEDQRRYRVATIFAALQRCLTRLEDYYQQLLDQPRYHPLTDSHPRFFPYPTRFLDKSTKKLMTFKYLHSLENHPACVTFLAKPLEESEGNIKYYVVKFVERYGMEAHSYMAREGYAPNLLYCGSLSGDHEEETPTSTGQGIHLGGLRMVIMEYIEQSQVPQKPYHSVLTALRVLHDGGFVHGDLRPPNVVYRGDKALLIDFDWSGKDSEVQYPFWVLERTKNIARITDLDRIMQEDDLAMLRYQFAK